MSLGKQLDDRSEPVPLESSLPRTPRFTALEGAFVIALLTLAAYLPSLSGGFLMDDDLLLTDNGLVKAPSGLYQIWCTNKPIEYYPISYSSFWLQWRLWGMNPTGYHLTNLLLHIAAALLIWSVLQKLAMPGAFLAALLYAVHPVNVESVAWIAQLREVLAMVFFLLSILCYVWEIDLPRTTDHGQRTTRWYWLSLLAFLLAMLSKGSVAILPLVLLLIVWWQRRRIAAVDLARIAPFFLVAIALTAMNVWFQTHGTNSVIRDASFPDRLAGAGAVVWFYLSKALLPIDLLFVYPLWHIPSGDLLWWLPLVALLGVTMLLLWRRGSGLGRPLWCAWAFFCVALVPVLGFADVGFMKYSLVADHYQHVALIGVVALVAAAWAMWRQQAREAVRAAATMFALVTVSAFVLLTWRQSRLFGDPIKLYQTTLERNPECALIHNNLGVSLFAVGRRQEGLQQYKEALRMNPEYEPTYINLGNALGAGGRLPEAIRCYQQALRLKPNSPEAHNNLGSALEASGNLAEATAHYQAALKLKPEFAEAHNNLGVVLEKAHNPQGAVDQYQQALRWRADFPESHGNMAHALLQMGRISEAIEHYQEALRLKPDLPAAHNDLGLALLNAARPKEALEEFQQALRFNREYAVAHANLALALDQLQRNAEALAAAQTALELARSQKDQSLVQELEGWLEKYRASHAEPSGKGPAN